MKISVLNSKGESTNREIELPSHIFEVEPCEHAVYLNVKNYLANQRQGNAKTKERGEIVGSTRKLRKQKGLGAARKGSIKSPILRGGGTVFGPRPRDYDFKLNRKTKILAMKSVLTARAQEKAINILENISFDSPKTKDFVSLIGQLSLDGKKVLFITDSDNKNFYLSSRNIQKAQVMTAEEVNTYNIINATQIVFFENALEKLNSRLN